MAPRFERPRGVVHASIEWVVRARFDETRAREVARDRATRGVTRPADAGTRVKITGATPMWLPFWRTELSIEGWKVDLTEPSFGDWDHDPFRKVRRVEVERVDEKSALSVCARRDFRDGIFGSRVDIRPSGVLRRDGDEGRALLARAPMVDADVDWPEAEAWARNVARSRSTGMDTVFSTATAKTLAMQFVWVPVYWVDYTYVGEADPGGRGTFFVALAEHDDRILHEAHPSRARAVLGRIRGVLSLDGRALDGALWRKPRA